MTTAADNPGVIRVGSTLETNDKRTPGHRVTVIGVDKTYATYQAGVRKARIRLDRIYTDGKPRSQGWNLVA